MENGCSGFTPGAAACVVYVVLRTHIYAGQKLIWLKFPEAELARVRAEAVSPPVSVERTFATSAKHCGDRL